MKIRIGLIGAGHLGKIHLKLLKINEYFDLVGVYDVNKEHLDSIAQEFGVTPYNDLESLLADVDAVDIVTPTIHHFEVAKQAILSGKHVFIEKPITEEVQQAEELIELVKAYRIKLQVGHVERFNPAIQKVIGGIYNPMFIEAHRLSEFKPRGTDVSVILDLMIHDIDLVLSMTNQMPDSIHASGVAVLSDTIDIANARLEFPSGCVANLTSSRVSIKVERKIRIFQENAYLSIDLQKKETNHFQLNVLKEGEVPASEMVYDPGEGKPKKEVIYTSYQNIDGNAIQDELTTFAKSIIDDSTPLVSVYDGANALIVAHKIIECCELNMLKSKQFIA